MDHVDPLLSAYLDGALTPVEHAEVDAHLAGCERCAGRLAELRATSRLLAALPAMRPSRTLVPRVAAAARWARPVRSLAAAASGLFVLVFIASAALQTGFGGGGSGALLAPAALPTAGQNAAPGAAPVAAPSAASDRSALSAPTATPRAQLATASPQAQLATGDKSVQSATASPALPPSGAFFGPAELSRDAREQRPAAPPSPLLWLALAAASAALAYLAHRRASAR